MSFLRTSSPQHKFRYSDQAWLRQDKTADHILRRLHERLVYGIKKKFKKHIFWRQIVSRYGHLKEKIVNWTRKSIKRFKLNLNQ